MGEFKRKQNFIDKTVQGGLIRRIFLHWLAFFFVTTIAVLLMKTLLGEPTMSFAERFSKEITEFGYMGIVFLAIFPAFMLDTVRFSNRFVGPIARLRRHLCELGENGETDDIKFRDNDFWQSIAGEFNAVNAMVQDQKNEIELLKSQLNSNAQPVVENAS